MSDKLRIRRKFDSLWLDLNTGIQLKPEHLFAFPRKYAADYAHIQSGVLIDLQGAVWMKGKSAHSSGTGIIRDCKKLFVAQELNYKMFYLTDSMITPAYLQSIAEIIKRELAARNVKKYA